jgi:hypothetical protein
MNYHLTTIERIKTKLSITEDGWDNILTNISFGITDFIQSQLNLILKEQEHIEILDGKNEKIYLLNIPILKILKLEKLINDKWQKQEIPKFNPKTGILDYKGSEGFQNIRVSYIAGYKIDFENQEDKTKHNLPFEISELAERLIIRQFNKLKDEGKQSVSFENSTTSWSELLDQTDKEIIGKYKRIWVV